MIKCLMKSLIGDVRKKSENLIIREEGDEGDLRVKVKLNKLVSRIFLCEDVFRFLDQINPLEIVRFFGGYIEGILESVKQFYK